MTTFASITPTPKTDGIDYCVAAVVPAAEGDLQATHQSPVPPRSGFEMALFAVVQLTATGTPATNATYVVLQTDLGDGVWVDVAWCVWHGTSGTAVFILQAGSNGAVAFAAPRAAGTSPLVTGFNPCALGGRFRFVGKSVLTSSSSSSSSSSGVPGTTPEVTATIRYRLYDYPGSV